jgi:hypothetical protein
MIRMIKSRRMKWVENVAWEKRNRILMGKLEGDRPQVLRRRTWKDNTKMDLREIGFSVMDWINLTQGEVKGFCEHCNEPTG